jgi:hypothetical protein
MRRVTKFAAGAVGLVLAWAGVAVAQTQADSQYVVFAKAGRVNYVAGSVTRMRDGATQGETLLLRDNLAAGEVVKTGAYGRTEVLLNPGAYLRADVNTEFAMLNTELDAVRVKLTRGSVLLEVLGPDNWDATLIVETPHTFVAIAKRGVYRLNVSAAETQIIVQKGRALVGGGQTQVKGGNQIIVGNGAAKVAKFDKKTLDGFDNWSSVRGAELAAINSRITEGAIRTAMNNSPYYAGFSRSYGMWVYDSFFRCWTFLPFSNSSWSSPYGWAYWNGMDYNGFMDWWGWRGGMVGGGHPGGGNTNPNNGNLTVTPGRVVVQPGAGGSATDTGDRVAGPPAKGGGASAGAGGRGAPGGGLRTNEPGRSLLIKREPDSGGFGSSGGSSSDVFSSGSSPRSSGSSSPSPAPAAEKPAPAPAPSSGGADRSSSPTKKPDNR